MPTSADRAAEVEKVNYVSLTNRQVFLGTFVNFFLSMTGLTVSKIQIELHMVAVPRLPHYMYCLSHRNGFRYGPSIYASRGYN